MARTPEAATLALMDALEDLDGAILEVSDDLPPDAFTAAARIAVEIRNLSNALLADHILKGA
jgi:hypothetical protein